MAIDSSILADIGKPGQGYSPLAAIERVGQFQDARLKRQDDRAAREQQAAIAAVMQKHGGDYDAAIDELQRVSPMAALELSKTVEANRKAITERRKTELDNDRAEAEQFARLIGNGDESSWRAAGAYASQRSPEMAQFFRQPYTPELATQVKSWGMTAQQKFEAEQVAIQSKKWEDWAKFYETDPEEADNAARVLMGPKDYDAMMTARKNADTARMNAEKSAEPAGFTLSQGQKRFDAEGNEIAGVAPRPVASAAASDGGLSVADQKLVEAVIKNPALYDKLTPTVRTRITAALSDQGFTPASASADGAGGAKLSATAVEKVAGVDQSIGMLNDIERLLPKMENFIGPLDGRAARARLATGAGITPELAEFDAQLTGLKNAVIKATTGAAMSEPEAKRIMGQLPDLSLPEAVFKARLATTRRNLELLKKRTIELSGGTVAPAPSGGGSADPLGIRGGR